VSVLSEILDRLSGVAVVRERLGETSQRVERLTDLMLDHERRLARLEAHVLEPRPAPSGKLPRKG